MVCRQLAWSSVFFLLLLPPPVACCDPSDVAQFNKRAIDWAEGKREREERRGEGFSMEYKTYIFERRNALFSLKRLP